MMCKKESIVIKLVCALVLLTAVINTRAEMGVDPNEPMTVESNDSTAQDEMGVDPNESTLTESNASAPASSPLSMYSESDDFAVSADGAELFDPNWPDDFDVEKVKVVLNFQNALVSDVLDYLSREAGLIIISDTIVGGRVNLVSKKPLNIDEVIALISTVLKKEGYTAIRTGRTLKIISLSSARSSNLPVVTINRIEDIVEGDDVITAVIPIRYANAIRLQEDIQPLLSDYAVISSNEASNSLIITDTTANIKRLVKIVKSVDTQMSTVADVKVFLLKYADARSTAELINEVFEQRASSSNGRTSQTALMQMMGGGGGMGGGGRGGRGGQQPQSRQMGSSSSGGAQNVPVIASADDRTNAVVVSGPADVLVVIEQVVTELDKNPDEDHQLFLYKLKYGQAANIRDRLNSLFQELENINQQNARTTGGGGRGGNTNASSSSSSDSVTDEVYIEADEDTNSLIIMTSSKNYDKIKGIIALLDIPIPQVLIKVLLAELTTSNATDIGIEWSMLNMRSNGDSFNNQFNYSPLPQEGLMSEIIAGDLTATLRALEEVGNLNILSRPYILTSNNQTATINVGQEYPFITDSTRTDTNNVVNTVEYRNIGIELEVTPSINSDGLVIMDINPTISAPAAETVTISQDFDATVFNSRTAQSRVSVPHGSTIVIGGLMQDTETDSVEKIPLLGDLPILGFLFKRTITDKSKTELLIFLTPQVASDVKELELLSNHEESLSEFINQKNSEVNPQSEAIKKQLEQMKSVYQEKIGEATSTQ